MAFLLLLFADKAKSVSVEEFNNDLLIYAEKQTIIEDKVSSFDNKVLLIFHNFTLEADHLFLDLKTGYGKATGSIRAIYGDIEILASELEFDVLMESVKITGAKVNLNDIIVFESEKIFATPRGIRVSDFKFRDDDKRLPAVYSVFMNQLNITPMYQGRYFYLQMDDLNVGLLDSERLSPIGLPAYEFFLRNPLIPREYVRQRRIRGFYEPGQFFFNLGYDAYRGPSVTGTMAYFSNQYSNGFITAEYGLWSNLEVSVYQDLADSYGNLVQFSGAFRLRDRFLNAPLAYGSLSVLHDWAYDTFRVNFSYNQPFGSTIINRLPEVSVFSLFRETFSGITYKYNISATRYLVENTTEKTSQDIGRIRFIGNVNTPRFFIRDNLYFQMLTESTYSVYLAESSQLSLGGELNLTHEVLSFLQYTLRYRQRWVGGSSPLAFENPDNNNFLGVHLSWWINDYVEFAAFSEFNLRENKFRNADFIVNYLTRYYQFSAYFDFLNIAFNSNVKVLAF